MEPIHYTPINRSCLDNIKLTANDIFYGIKHNFILKEDADNLIIKLIDPDEFKFLSEPEFIFKKVNQKFSTEIKEKWLFIILRCVFTQRKLYKNPLDIVEMIYADFDYPKEIDSFVKYMPPKDGYDPSIHSFDENISRLYANWEAYIKDKDHIYLK